MSAFLAGQRLLASALNAEFANLFLSSAVAATVATLETRTLTSFGNLATVGPAVTIPSSGQFALVLWSCNAWNNANTDACQMGVAVSGATTIAASAARALKVSQITGSGNSLGDAHTRYALLAINPGSNTFTAQYAVSAGTGNFRDRDIFVLAP